MAAVLQGLGTALILAIVGQLRDLEARSNAGQGSTVTIRIPLRTQIALAERADAEEVNAEVNAFLKRIFCRQHGTLGYRAIGVRRVIFAG